MIESQSSRTFSNAIWGLTLFQVVLEKKMAADAHIAYFEDGTQTLKRILPDLETHFEDVGLSAYWIAGLHFHLGENGTSGWNAPIPGEKVLCTSNSTPIMTESAQTRDTSTF